MQIDPGLHRELHRLNGSLCLPAFFKCEDIQMKSDLYRLLWFDENGQDIAEYAVMLAVILVIVVGTVQLIGSHANGIFSSVASSLE